MNNILDVSGVSVRFGGLTALDDVGFSVPQGAVTALIGPNGAGKTTCFNVLSGLQRSSGVVAFNGKDISAVPAHRRVGLGRTFQIVQLFGGMTVEQSVMVGCQRRGKGNILSIGLGLPGVGRAEAEIAERTRDILQRLGLWRAKDRLASDLPLGQQRLVELARALASEPTLLMLDEAASGLSPGELELLEAQICMLKGQGMSILMVEHNMRFVGRVSDYMTVLNFGKVIFKGTSTDGLKSSAVVTAYLGKPIHNA